MFLSPTRVSRDIPPIPVSGRDREAGRLRAAFDRCQAGRGGVITLHGSVGCGRSEVLHGFCEFAEAGGASVLTAAGAPLERDFPLGVVRQLFQSPGLDPELVTEAEALIDQGAAAGPPPAWAAPGETPDGTSVRPTARLLHELSSLLLGLARRRPVLLAVDDRQDADAQSLEFLLYLVRRTRGSRVLTVLASRETMTPTDPFFEVELARQPHHERIRLELFPPAVVAQVLRERLATPAADRWAAEAHALTGGNPLLVRALVEDQEQAAPGTGGDLVGDLVVGENYRRGLMNCLHRIDPLALRVARGVAALGRPADPALLSELLLLTRDSTPRALHLLHAAGLFRDGGFRHPTGGGDLLAAMRPAELAALHRRAAQLLQASGAPAEHVAEQLRAAEGHVRAPWAVPAQAPAPAPAAVPAPAPAAVPAPAPAAVPVPAEPAYAVPAAPHAVHAVPFGAVDESGAVYESREVADHVRTGAVPVGGDADDAFAPPGGETGGGEDVIECVPWLAEPDATVTPSQELKGVRYLFWHGRTDEGLAALARYETGHPDGPGDSTELRTWLRYWYPGLAVPDAPADGGPEAGSPGAAEGPYAPETDGMAALAALLDGLPAADAVRRAERVLRESRLGRVPVRSITAALTVLLYADQADRAARWCAGAVSRAEHTWDPAGDALLATLTAESALRQGDLRTAEEYARTAFQRIRPGSWGVGVGFPLATMIEARTALGRHEDAARYAALRVPEAMFDTPAGLHYRHARGRHRLAVGAAEQALADFRACGETMARWNVDHLPGLVPWRIGAARAQLALGRPREARALADQQLARLDPGPSRVRGMALRTRAAAGEPAERTALLQHAARALEESGDRYELSAALTDLSAAHGEQGDPARARTVERRARHLSRITGTESAATEDDLSEAERRVAELAARGLTNREIARKLYITVSTVEQHLTRVYRKLGVQRRMELRYSLDSQRGLAG